MVPQSSMHSIFGSVSSSFTSHIKVGPNIVASHLSWTTFGDTASVRTFTFIGLISDYYYTLHNSKESVNLTAFKNENDVT